MSIVVTGAAGLIGSGVIRYLNDQGKRELVVVDELDHPEKVRNLAGKQYRERVSIQGLFKWLEGREDEIAAFIHLGACSDTLEKNEQFLHENNTDYTRKLALYALKHGHRFIYASSAATYGDGRDGFSDDHAKLPLLKPLNLYGLSKHRFDLWAYNEGIVDQIVGLKYFNVFGPNEQHKGRMASMVYKMIPIVQNEGVIRLYRSSEPDKYDDGGQCRDFIYVKRAVEMTAAFLDNDETGIYNIGMGQPTTWNTLATAVFKALNKPRQIDYIEMPQDLVGQYQNYTCADMTKFDSKISLPRAMTIEEAVRDYVQNHIVVGRPW